MALLYNFSSDTCRYWQVVTVNIFIYHVSIMIRGITVQMSYDTRPFGHESYCSYFHLTPVHIDSWRTTWKFIYMCAYSHAGHCRNFDCARVLLVRWHTVQISCSTCTYWFVGHCRKIHFTPVQLNTCHTAINFIWHIWVVKGGVLLIFWFQTCTELHVYFLKTLMWDVSLWTLSIL